MADGAALRWDVALYGGCSLFAAGLGAFSGLTAHRTWAQVATVGYAVAALVASGQWLLARRGLSGAGVVARSLLAGCAWLVTAMVPMLLFALGRAAGRGSRAQVEVRVIEWAGDRWLNTGTPYLDRDLIASLPAADQLGAYAPYQPVMAVFGVPRALDPGSGWWSDARIWFTVAALAALVGAVVTLRDADAGARLRALQAVTILPSAALAATVGGDDLPVLALCLLALAMAARSRMGTAGLVVGAAAALKLIAWPVAVVLAVHAATHGRRPLVRYGLGAVGVPVLTLLPALLADPRAVLENTVLFPLGLGLVSSPADAPLPGQLIASQLPGGKAIAIGLLLAAGLGFAVWLWRRPPRTAAVAAAVCAFGLFAAMGLMPATRFGYLLYPLALLLWLPALQRSDGRSEVCVREPVREPALAKI
jgi:hypothetical protein